MTHDETPVRASQRGTTADDLPEYLAVDPPEDKDRTEYNTAERRAEVLDLVFEAGSPKRLNYAELARYYDVHRTTIKRDVDAVADDVAAHLGHRAELKIYAVYEKAIDKLLDENPREAWKTAKEFGEWLASRPDGLEEKPDRLEVDQTVRNVGDSSAYEVIPDDNAEAIEFVENKADEQAASDPDPGPDPAPDPAPDADPDDPDVVSGDMVDDETDAEGDSEV